MSGFLAIHDPVRIGNLIPQRAPIVLVDALLDFSAQTLRSSFTPSDQTIFVKNGQFTEPGIVEHMAQSVALHTGYAYFLKGIPAPTGYIGSIGRCEIFGLPSTNRPLTSQVRIVQEFGGVTLVEIETHSNGVRIASAQMKTVIAND